jgi:hypothetical protein
MFHWLDRLLSRRQRLELGAERVGMPMWEIHAAITETCESEPFQDVRSDALEYYFEKFLGSWLPRIIEQTLSTRQLAQLDPHRVKQTAFLLLAQAARKLRNHLVPDGFPQKDSGLWVERFLVQVSSAAELDPSAYSQWVLQLESLDDNAMEQVIALGNQLGVSGNELCAYHRVMIDLVLEDVLGIADDGAES